MLIQHDRCAAFETRIKLLEDKLRKSILLLEESRDGYEQHADNCHGFCYCGADNWKANRDDFIELAHACLKT